MKIDRLISIIMILLDKKRISAQTLAETFEVSVRTIYRDIDAIDRAGIPVRAISGVGGGFEIIPNYKLDHKVFSNNDLTTILQGLSSLSNIMGGDAMIHALTKVRSFIPAEQANEIELRANQIHIDLNPWMGTQHTKQNLERIKIAIQESQVITFDYADRHDTKTKRRVEPYQLILKNSRWYWQGYCLKRQSFRLFRLSRMTNVFVSTMRFIPREYEPPQLDFSETLATLQSSITLRVKTELKDRLRDFCDEEAFVSDGPEHYIVEFPFVDNDFHYNLILGFGLGCECVGPPKVRQELKQRVQKLFHVYQH